MAKYRAKRDFARTREPQGSGSGKESATFVVQKHAASRLHYDFRLEVDGVLKSWAVPKEIPVHVGAKALAVMVEDHPIEYGEFEGTIPKGQYGGGTVMLWDRGTYRAESGDVARSIAGGKIHMHLTGKKLRGEWALVRMRRDDKQWLLIKAGEDFRPQAATWDLSSKSGRTMVDIGAGETMPAFLEPMKCKPVKVPPTGKEWLYELKFDGYRFLGGKSGSEARLWSRAENDFTSRFPAVAKAMAKLKARSALVDGELVVPDELGRPSFQLIQNADESTVVRAFLFDLLEVDGEDLRRESLEARRARLAAILPKRSPLLLLSGELTGEPTRLLAEVAARGLEGLIAKRRDSIYEPGRRSGAWCKIRCLREQEFVVGGFTAPRGARSHFGALLVGYYRGKELVFAGKVGTGFNERMLADLRAQMIARRMEKCPFAALPTHRSRWGTAFTRAELGRCTWVKPQLVAQVRFAEWTGDHLLRQPAFLGLRNDKAAREVVRET
ncbi:MAG: non-homologous end-joining DNA ligase [Chthoniobacteraceae bacterium]